MSYRIDFTDFWQAVQAAELERLREDNKRLRKTPQTQDCERCGESHYKRYMTRSGNGGLLCPRCSDLQNESMARGFN